MTKASLAPFSHGIATRAYVCAMLVCALAMVGCSNLLYYPSRKLFVDPTRLQPNPINTGFTGSQGLQIKGWHFVSLRPQRLGKIIFFHGNGQNRSAQFMHLFWLVKEGYDLFVFDYPGYGQTGGSPSPESTVRMAVDTIRFVQTQEVSLPLIVYGHSLGGAIAGRAVWELRGEVVPNVLILDSTFLSYRDAAQSTLAHSAWTWAFQWLARVVISDKWAPKDRLKDLKGRVVVVHSRADQVIPFTLGQELFQSLKSREKDPSISTQLTEFIEIQNADHNQIYSSPQADTTKQQLLRCLTLTCQAPE